MKAAMLGDAWELWRKYESDRFLPLEEERKSRRADEGQLPPASLFAVDLGGWMAELEDRVDQAPLETVLDEVGVELPLAEAMLVARSFTADAEAAVEASSRSLGRVSNWLALLSSEYRYEGMSDTDVSNRLALAAEFLQGSEAEYVKQAVGDERFAAFDVVPSQIRPAVRDGRVGPWDAEEVEILSPSYIDLGALAIPYVFGMRIRPEWDRGVVCGVNLAIGGTEIKLEALHMDGGGLWDGLLGGIRGSLFSRGVVAESYLASLGVELRARVPHARRASSMSTRFLGCEGPGWLLRGTVEHPQDAYFHHNQVRRVFVDTVVNPSASAGRDRERMHLRWPPSHGWDERLTPVY
ncbi:DUF3710 domain-containing protein [Streptomyces sp. MAR4 CNX-425]|uniref:DUF3710 domain-containing protein n=1 Tax=Streptomyces sp. MAR4 CNX-425 TaxID=3406343 RepID=UPI003B509E60